MPIHDQRIFLFGTWQADAGTQHIVTTGAKSVALKGGHLFGVFRPVIGLSTNRAVIITEWPDEASAKAFGHLISDGVEGAHLESHDLLEPATRPKPGGRPNDQGGVYSHRAFDILEADWPRFLELSVAAWDNFEDAHDARVAGFWKCRTPPAAGHLRVRLMAWYQSLDAWERSRWWNPDAREGSEASFARFRERSQMLRDTGVSILTRVPFPGETKNPALPAA